MYQVSYAVRTPADIKNIADKFQKEHPASGGHLLILVFTHWVRKEDITSALDLLAGLFPKARVAGMTVAGGIQDSRCLLEDTVVSFLSFQEASVSLLPYDLTTKTSAEAGEEALAALDGMKDLSGVCILSTMWNTDAAAMASALSQLPETVSVFGGGSAAPGDTRKNYVFCGKRIYEKGTVLIAFCGHLRIGVKSILGWNSMGRHVVITKMHGSRTIQTLDGHPAVEIYEKYLKIKPSQNFRKEILSFPLLLMRHGKTIARLPSGCRSDGSLIMNSDCREGETVRLAYGDPNEIIHTCQTLTRRIRHFRPEGLLMFSGVTRRLFMKDDNTGTILTMYRFAPFLAGGYVCGEIKRTSGVVDVLNMAQVTVGFSEKELSEKDKKEYLAPVPDTPVTLSDSLSTLERLAAFVSTTSEELEKAYQQISYVADHDGLTDLYNRGAIERIMEEQVAAAQEGDSLSAIMVDLDNFKKINDTYGHEEGDRVLENAARRMKENIRFTDYAGRWGGDEFVILLPHTTLPQAEKIARRIRAAFASVPEAREKHITASFGCTTTCPGDTQETFYHHMDEALYQAKKGGKDRVVVLGTGEPDSDG